MREPGRRSRSRRLPSLISPFSRAPTLLVVAPPRPPLRAAAPAVKRLFAFREFIVLSLSVNGGNCAKSARRRQPIRTIVTQQRQFQAKVHMLSFAMLSFAEPPTILS